MRFTPRIDMRTVIGVFLLIALIMWLLFDTRKIR